MGIDGVDRAANLGERRRDARDEVLARFRQRDASRRAVKQAHAGRASNPATALLKAVVDMPISAAAPRKLRRRATATTDSSSINPDLCIVPVFETSHVDSSLFSD